MRGPNADLGLDVAERGLAVELPRQAALFRQRREQLTSATAGPSGADRVVGMFSSMPVSRESWNEASSEICEVRRLRCRASLMV